MKFKIFINIYLLVSFLKSEQLQDQNTKPSNFNPDCACQHLMECPKCGDLNPKPIIYCPCAPPLQCPVCPYIGMRSIKSIHDAAANEALIDAQSQENLMKQSELQAKLFALAEKYAKEAMKEEQHARKSAQELQESSSRAQIARNKMQRAVMQAKQLALKTFNDKAMAMGLPQMLQQDVLNNKVVVDFKNDQQKNKENKNDKDDSKETDQSIKEDLKQIDEQLQK